MAFCNSCGGDMQDNLLQCPRCGSSHGPVATHLATTSAPEGLPQKIELRPLNFGRAYACLMIAGGAILGLMILSRSGWIDPRSNHHHRLEIGAVISLITGYGLLKRQIWALYLMTGAFLMRVLEIMTADERQIDLSFSPMGVLWGLIGLWYFWEHRRELQ